MVFRDYVGSEDWGRYQLAGKGCLEWNGNNDFIFEKSRNPRELPLVVGP